MAAAAPLSPSSPLRCGVTLRTRLRTIVREECGLRSPGTYVGAVLKGRYTASALFPPPPR